MKRKRYTWPFFVRTVSEKESLNQGRRSMFRVSILFRKATFRGSSRKLSWGNSPGTAGRGAPGRKRAQYSDAPRRGKAFTDAVTVTSGALCGPPRLDG